MAPTRPTRLTRNRPAEASRLVAAMAAVRAAAVRDYRRGRRPGLLLELLPPRLQPASLPRSNENDRGRQGNARDARPADQKRLLAVAGDDAEHRVENDEIDVRWSIVGSKEQMARAHLNARRRQGRWDILVLEVVTAGGKRVSIHQAENGEDLPPLFQAPKPEPPKTGEEVRRTGSRHQHQSADSAGQRAGRGKEVVSAAETFARQDLPLLREACGAAFALPLSWPSRNAFDRGHGTESGCGPVHRASTW